MNMATRDYYEILGVPREASQEDIRKAYLDLAKRYHPDKTGGDKAAEEKLKEVNMAYDTLKNADKRAQYDRFGQAGEHFGGGGGGFEGFGGFGGFGGQGAGFETPFEDFFDVLFGRGGAGGRRRAATPGNDLEVRLSVNLREAAFGTKKQVKLNRMEMCGDCNGSGAAPGTQPQTCPDCGGAGQVRRAQGFFSITQTCPKCRGTGRIVSKPCPKCNGTSRVRLQRDLSVDLPPGVDTGTRLRVAGEGEPGDGGPRGDLYIYIEVLPDDVFTRDGNDLHVEIPITFVQAALGAKIRVPTLRGAEAELQIPPGTQSGTLFRMRNQGVPDLRGYRQGDQIVRVQVETPTRLSREQKELLQRFQESVDNGAYPLHRRFLDRLKNSRTSG